MGLLAKNNDSYAIMRW